MDNMYYSVDKIESDKIVLINQTDNSIEIIDCKQINETIKEGMILKKENNKYYIDKKQEIIIKKRIENKFNKLKK